MKNTSREWPKQLLPVVIIFLLLPLLAAGYRVLRNRLSDAVNGFFFPYLELSRHTVGRISDRTLLAYDRPVLASRIEELQNQNRRLALQSEAAAELLEENRELRRILALPPPAEWRFIVSEILIRDPLLRQESFTVNRGRRHGVVKGDAAAVLSGDGRLLLAGIVGDVQEHTAKVETICNPSVHVSGRLSSSGAVGFLNTGETRYKTGQIALGYLPEDSTFVRGEAVTTTGFEYGIPAGLRIGVLNDSGGRLSPFASTSGYLSCGLTPAVRFDRLRFLIILDRRRNTP